MPVKVEVVDIDSLEDISFIGEAYCDRMLEPVAYVALEGRIMDDDPLEIRVLDILDQMKCLDLELPQW